MKLFLVFQDEAADILRDEKCNLMLSFAAIGKCKDIPRGFPEVMLDSGGYQLQTGVTVGRTISITAYTSWLQFNLPKFPEVTAYMNLDLRDDPVASIRNLQYMESEGLHPLPVWHPKDGDDILDFYAKDHDYIAIGAIAKGQKMVIRSIFERVKVRYPEHKFHLLGVGLNASAALVNLRPYSVDFSTWMNPFRYGMDLVWSDKDGLLHEYQMDEAWRMKVRKDKEFRRDKVREVLQKLKRYAEILDNYQSPGMQAQFGFEL